MKKAGKQIGKVTGENLNLHRISGGGVNKKAQFSGVDVLQNRPGPKDQGETATIKRGNVQVTINAPKGFHKGKLGE